MKRSYQYTRYTGTRPPGSLPAPWKLTPEQQALAETYLNYAYAISRRLARKWNLDRNDARSAGHYALIQAVHYQKHDGPYLKRNIRLWVQTALIDLLKARTKERPQPIYAHQALANNRLNFDVIDGRALWQFAKDVLPQDHYRILFRRLVEGDELQAIAEEEGILRQKFYQLYNQIVAQLRLAVEQTHLLGCTGLGSAQRPDNAN